MPKPKKDKHFIKKAYYPGGVQAMRNFIKKHLKYPPEARQANVQGRVQLSLIIDHKGIVKKANIIKGLGHGCDEEAQRVAKMLRFNVPPPPSNKKLRLQFSKNINIHFRLPEPQRPAFIYTTTPTSSDSQNTPYHYTISWSAAEEE